jgi:hypothetical protein
VNTYANATVGTVVNVAADHLDPRAAVIVKIRPYGSTRVLVTFRTLDTGDEWTWRRSTCWPLPTITPSDLEVAQ